MRNLWDWFHNFISFKQHPEKIIRTQLQENQRKFLEAARYTEYFRYQTDYYEREIYRLQSMLLKGDFSD